jgi:hypothetical protein
MQVIKKQSVKKQNRRASLKVCIDVCYSEAHLLSAQELQVYQLLVTSSVVQRLVSADLHQDHELHTPDAYTLQSE